MAQDKSTAAKPAAPVNLEAKSSSPAGAPSVPSAKGPKGGGPLPDGCHSWGCKAKAKAFSFCDEHYDHFKFGLIKKTGEPVPDYEKKLGHYLAHKKAPARKSA